MQVTVDLHRAGQRRDVQHAQPHWGLHAVEQGVADRSCKHETDDCIGVLARFQFDPKRLCVARDRGFGAVLGVLDTGSGFGPTGSA